MASLLLGQRVRSPYGAKASLVLEVLGTCGPLPMPPNEVGRNLLHGQSHVAEKHGTSPPYEITFVSVRGQAFSPFDFH